MKEDKEEKEEAKIKTSKPVTPVTEESEKKPKKIFRKRSNLRNLGIYTESEFKKLNHLKTKRKVNKFFLPLILLVEK
jgi:hypothetical protein